MMLEKVTEVISTLEICLLCYQQLVNKSAIVSKFCLFELKFPTTMFHLACVYHKKETYKKLN